MPREYKSFDEIDQHLSVLKLQRKIDLERLKLNFYRAKVELAPSNLLRGLGTTFNESRTWKNVLVAIIANKLLGILRKKHQKKIH